MSTDELPDALLLRVGWVSLGSHCADQVVPLPELPPLVKPLLARVAFKLVAAEHPAFERLLEGFRQSYVNGDARLACFEVSGEDAAAWLSQPRRKATLSYGDLSPLLRSPALFQFHPTLGPQLLAPIDDVIFMTSSAFRLDGEIAEWLWSGGAYNGYGPDCSFQGTPGDAKRLALDACSAMFGDRYDDVSVDYSGDAWSEFFYTVAWDLTWVVMDRGASRVWLLCVTDTD
jgi:hypothetical protein